MCRCKIIVLIIVVASTACNSDSNNEITGLNPYPNYQSEFYATGDNWLCHPTLMNTYEACNTDLSSTLVFEDGSTMIEPLVAGTNPEIDCFYLYPTVSEDARGNSDFEPGREFGAVQLQFARYGITCRLFAPLYRQITLEHLRGNVVGDPEIAFADVMDSFQHYISNADGRGFILVGHSQGASILARLVRDVIEANDYLLEHMISAHLIGTTIHLRQDSDFGQFAFTPPCSSEQDIHCFVSYASYRESAPPNPNITGHTGVSKVEGARVACVNPSEFSDGQVFLDSYFRVSDFGPFVDEDLDSTVSTPFYKIPDFITGECIQAQDVGYLAIRIFSDANGPRLDKIGGDSSFAGGLHGIDMQLGIGSLVTLAQRQADSWLREQL